MGPPPRGPTYRPEPERANPIKTAQSLVIVWETGAVGQARLVSACDACFALARWPYFSEQLWLGAVGGIRWSAALYFQLRLVWPSSHAASSWNGSNSVTLPSVRR